jgi:aryl-alcohol dehydrogenase-like predicted oxidoreductase
MSWTGSHDEESLRALDRALSLGCNFFDTAWIYGEGHSETLLGRALRAHRGERIRVATKVPPKNWEYPATAAFPVSDAYPRDARPFPACAGWRTSSGISP